MNLIELLVDFYVSMYRGRRGNLSETSCDTTKMKKTLPSERLDPEELRDVVRLYQQVYAEVADRFERHSIH